MVSCSPELAIELGTAVLFLILIIASPRKAALVAGILATGAGYLQTYGTLSPFTIVHGDKVVGKRSMAAVVYNRLAPHGLHLAFVPVPSHSPTQLLVRVSAATLRPSELQGRVPLVIPWIRHLWKVLPGSDVAGQVVSVGQSAQCAFVQVGDSVFGSTSGSLAEYAVLSCESCAKRPRLLSHVQAATLPAMLLPIMAALDFAEAEVKKLHAKSQLLPLSSIFSGSYGGAGVMLAQSFMKFSSLPDSTPGLTQQRVLLVVGNDSKAQFALGVARAMGAEVAVAGRSADSKTFRGAKFVINYQDSDTLSSLEKRHVQFDIILDAVTSVNKTDNPPNMRFLLSPTGVYTSLNTHASPLWWTLLKPLGFVASWLGGDVLLKEDFHSFLRRPPGVVLRRCVQWFEEGALPILPAESVVAVTTNVPLWQTFDRIKAGQGRYNPVFTFPIGASAM